MCVLSGRDCSAGPHLRPVSLLSALGRRPRGRPRGRPRAWPAAAGQGPPLSSSVCPRPSLCQPGCTCPLSSGSQWAPPPGAARLGVQHVWGCTTRAPGPNSPQAGVLCLGRPLSPGCPRRAKVVWGRRVGEWLEVCNSVRVRRENLQGRAVSLGSAVRRTGVGASPSRGGAGRLCSCLSWDSGPQGSFVLLSPLLSTVGRLPRSLPSSPQESLLFSSGQTFSAQRWPWAEVPEELLRPAGPRLLGASASLSWRRGFRAHPCHPRHPCALILCCCGGLGCPWAGCCSDPPSERLLALPDFACCCPLALHGRAGGVAEGLEKQPEGNGPSLYVFESRRPRGTPLFVVTDFPHLGAGEFMCVYVLNIVSWVLGGPG